MTDGFAHFRKNIGLNGLLDIKLWLLKEWTGKKIDITFLTSAPHYFFRTVTALAARLTTATVVVVAAAATTTTTATRGVDFWFREKDEIGEFVLFDLSFSESILKS